MSVVFVHYNSIGAILKAVATETGEITVNSRVVAAAIRPAHVYQLDHVTFTLRHNQVTNQVLTERIDGGKPS